MVNAQVSLAFFSSCFIFLISGTLSATFTVVNQCNYKVWPGILSGAGTTQLAPTGFMLNPGQSVPVSVPTGWSGRLWGRTFCSQDSSTGKFVCATGDCGSGTLECSGGGAAPPATLAEFTLNGGGGLDFYDVSLVDGYNLPMLISPQGAGTGVGNCSTTGCVVDLNQACPNELKKMMNSYGSTGNTESVGCKSACEAFGDPRYCCSGSYATPDTCKPTDYSSFFKSACPRSYSYAYDDGTSTFTCGFADYVITFCPVPSASQKSSGISYAGVGDGSLATSRGVLTNRPLPFLTSLIITILAAVWDMKLLCHLVYMISGLSFSQPRGSSYVNVQPK